MKTELDQDILFDYPPIEEIIFLFFGKVTENLRGLAMGSRLRTLSNQKSPAKLAGLSFLIFQPRFSRLCGRI